MKKILFSLMLLCCAIAGKSQSDVYTATLQHGDEVKVFYGTSALSQAVAAAEDGDAINLSAGNFGGVNITKAVSVYGAGFEEDEATGTDVTLMTGGLSINSSNVHLEGLRVNGAINFGAVSDIIITKCYWGGSEFFSPASLIEISKCVIIGNFNCKNQNHQGLRVLNSVIGSIRNVTLDSRIQVDHCMVYDDYSGPLLYTNSLLVNGYVSSSAIAENSTQLCHRKQYPRQPCCGKLLCGALGGNICRWRELQLHSRTHLRAETARSVDRYRRHTMRTTWPVKAGARSPPLRS